MGSATSTTSSSKDHYSPFVKASNADRRKSQILLERKKKTNEQPTEIISAVFVIHDKAKLLKYISWNKLWENFLASPASSFTIGIHIYLNIILLYSRLFISTK